MAKNKQGRSNDSMFPARTEREWWMEHAQNEAQAHWLPEVAEQAYKEGLTPKAAAQLMRDK